MAALPKRKLSKASKGHRARHFHASKAHLVVCPQCRLPKPTHQVCPSCGFYKGRNAVTVDNPARPT